MQASVVCSACRNEVLVTDHEYSKVICSRYRIVVDRMHHNYFKKYSQLENSSRGSRFMIDMIQMKDAVVIEHHWTCSMFLNNSE